MARLRAISCKERMLALWFSPPFGQLGPSTDSGWALDAVMLERRRIVAKCFMLIEREGACLFVSARKQVAGPEDYSDGSGSPEVGAQGGLGLHVRQKCQSFLCGLPAARQTGAEHSPFRRRGRLETTMGAAESISTDLLTTSS